jgi:hypothetical protein
MVPAGERCSTVRSDGQVLGSLLKCSLGSEEPDTANGVAFQQLADAPTQHGTNQDVGVED